LIGSSLNLYEKRLVELRLTLKARWFERLAYGPEEEVMVARLMYRSRNYRLLNTGSPFIASA
jgi:hypothetical protein